MILGYLSLRAIWDKRIRDFVRFGIVSLRHKWIGTNYFHDRVRAQVASQSTEQLKLEKFKNIPKILGVKDKYPASNRN